MGIGSWLKKLRKREDADAMHRAQEEYFDTPEEQRIQSGDIEGMQADRFVQRWNPGSEGGSGSADPEERRAEEEER